MLPSKLKIVCCHISRLVRKHLLCKIEVWNFKVTTILGRACDGESEFPDVTSQKEEKREKRKRMTLNVGLNT
jgi:hypothetical protein